MKERYWGESLRSIKYHFVFMLFLFFLSAFFGYFTAEKNSFIALEQIKALAKSFSFVKTLSPIEIFLLIFINNSLKAILSTVTGIFFGIFPACFVVINGYLVGVVYYVKGSQIGYFKALMYLLPHGVVEIPAILLACSYGSWLGLRFFKKLRGENLNIREDFNFAVKECIRKVIPLLLVAALIETFVTPLIVKLV